MDEMDAYAEWTDAEILDWWWDEALCNYDEDSKGEVFDGYD